MPAANTHRGETVLRIGSVDLKTCLTLGALAEIEIALGCSNFAELPLRLKAMSADEMSSVLSSILRGGGADEDQINAALRQATPRLAAKTIADTFSAALG